MASIPQNFRYATPDPNDKDNPEKLYAWIKPPRALSGAGPPAASLGEVSWTYMDTLLGLQWIKDAGGVWVPLLDWALLPVGSGNVGPVIQVDQINSLPSGTTNIIIDANPGTLTCASTNTLVSGNVGSYQGVNSCVMGSVAGSVLIQAATTVNMNATAGPLSIAAQGVGQLVTLSAATGAVALNTRQLSAALLPGGAASVLTSPAGLTLGGSSSSIAMTGAGVAISTPPAQSVTIAAPAGLSVTLGGLNLNSTALTGCSSINGSSSNTDFRYIRTNAAGVLSSAGYPPQTFCGSFTNFSPNATAYWEPAAGVVSPADFFAYLPLSDGAVPRVLAGYTLCFQTNTPAWQITAGTMALQIGYVAIGLPLTVANFVQMVGVFVPTLTSFPDIRAFANVSIPLGARLAARIQTVGAGFTSAGCDALLAVLVA